MDCFVSEKCNFFGNFLEEHKGSSSRNPVYVNREELWETLAMAITTTATLLFCSAEPIRLRIPFRACSSYQSSSAAISPSRPVHRILSQSIIHDPIALSGLLGTGLVAAVFLAAEPASAAAATDFPVVGSLQLSEPANALSLPTWAVHVSSVVEWATAMVLVWRYGERKGYEAWKGLSWGMVPLLGGALCACTWHFFYNAESLEVLVALQAALTVIGNMTMCIAAFRINKSTTEVTEKP
ncbi:PREDICTED: uncharacterized protein LOC104814025 [Tarenaya hassleriana]|uniref:uncharacterized protein LOC104814025 n=1 Tax=Tarenaya hassleriana TaxID=28532 RepID=UPI0008FD7990|nr:PREDICTED: uncharacterized protein LOC104814025 [Tarenaya hassleriana]